MNYAIISGTAITAHGTASVLWPDTSFAATGPNAAFLSDAGAVPIRSDAPYDPATEILVPCSPYLLDGEAFDQIAALLPPAPEPEPEPDWGAFRQAILTENGYVEATAIALNSPSDIAQVAATYLSDRLTAFETRGNWSDYLQGLVLTMSALEPLKRANLGQEFLELAQRCHLPGDFIAAFQAIIPQSPPPE